MGREKELDNILEECLERLARGENLEQCLAGHPAEAARLEPLLRMAMLVKKTSAVAPDSQFREQARLQFKVAVCAAAQPKPRRTFGWLSWQPRWATAAIVAVLIFIVAGSGTLAAANTAMPDETLYPVKLAAENIRVTLTRSDSAKAQLYASLADKRVDEIVKMAEKGKVEQVEKATEKMDAYLQKVVMLTAVPGKGAATLQAPRAAPQPAVTSVPAPTPVPAPSIKVTPTTTPEPRMGVASAPEPAGQVKKDATANNTTAKNGATKPSVAKAATSKDKVKAVIAELAVKHPEALKEALENAPESVKPALRRAIAVSVADYKEALEALESEDAP